MKGNVCLAGARGHVDQDTSLPAQDGANDAVDGDFLIVAERLAGNGKARRKKPLLLALPPSIRRGIAAASKVPRVMGRIR